MASRINHQQLVQNLLDTKAVSFEAIGKTLTSMGPSLSIADEPWDVFCGTMRHFVHVYIINPFYGNPAVNPAVDNLAALKGVARELQG